jgi:predicted acetyltransferase
MQNENSINCPSGKAENIRFVPVKHDSDSKFLSMYKNYLQTLTRYSDYLAIYSQSERFIRENYIEDEVLQSYYVCAGNQIVGFIVLQYIDERHEVNPPMWYIVEFYIAPEYQGRGYGTKAMAHFLQEYPGPFFYYIFKRNTPAQFFWASITQRYALKEVARADLECGDPDLELHSFERGVIKC